MIDIEAAARRYALSGECDNEDTKENKNRFLIPPKIWIAAPFDYCMSLTIIRK
jgi:hypothetical protein